MSPHPHLSQTPCPGTQGAPPCRCLKTQCPEERPLEMPASSRRGQAGDPCPPAQTWSGLGLPGHSGPGRGRVLLRGAARALWAPPRPLVHWEPGRGPGRASFLGLVPLRRVRGGLGSGLPAEKRGQGGPRPPHSLVSESHPRRGQPLSPSPPPGVGMQRPEPTGPARAGFEPAACKGHSETWGRFGVGRDWPCRAFSLFFSASVTLKARERNMPSSERDASAGNPKTFWAMAKYSNNHKSGCVCVQSRMAKCARLQPGNGVSFHDSPTLG